MIIYKTAKEIEMMRRGGAIAAEVLQEVSRYLRPGISTWEIDQFAEKMIREKDARPSFKGFEGFRFSTCINVNSGVVHGIPKKTIILQVGDIVKVDLGVLYNSLHTDTASSFLIGNTPFSEEKTRFLKVGKKALSLAIRECRPGNRIGDISAKIQEIIEGNGYSVIDDLVGHGVGHYLHEDPQVPGCGKPHTGHLLKEGMTLAIEVIYASGRGKIISEDDGWTLSTIDGRISGLFEHTVSLGRKGVEILTLGGCLC